MTELTAKQRVSALIQQLRTEKVTRALVDAALMELYKGNMFDEEARWQYIDALTLTLRRGIVVSFVDLVETLSAQLYEGAKHKELRLVAPALHDHLCALGDTIMEAAENTRRQYGIPTDDVTADDDDGPIVFPIC